MGPGYPQQGFPQGGWPQQGPPPPKRTSALTIFLIILGVVLVLGGGTCAGLIMLARHGMKTVSDSIADGGLVLVSPPAVTAALGKDKKSYVGTWTSSNGSKIAIVDDGSIEVVRKKGSSSESVTDVIAEFRGDDIVVKAVFELVVHVTKPPHQVGDHWEMTADDVEFQRSSAPPSASSSDAKP